MAEVSAREPECIRILPPGGSAHPVRLFTEATAIRPHLARLAPAAAFTARCEAEPATACPAEADGRVLFPFRRV
jgi:trans-aconitate 2-methyltransferase